jgi:hypothetical protein
MTWTEEGKGGDYGENIQRCLQAVYEYSKESTFGAMFYGFVLCALPDSSMLTDFSELCFVHYEYIQF